MFQARDIMELPPDPSNNPHLKRQDEIFRSGIQPIISDDAALGKRKASLTEAEGAKARKIASIVQSDFMHELQRPEEFYRPEPLAFNAPVVHDVDRAPLASWYREPTEFKPPSYLVERPVSLNPDQNPLVYRRRSPLDHNHPTLTEALERDTNPYAFTTLRMWFGDHPSFKSEL